MGRNDWAWQRGGLRKGYGKGYPHDVWIVKNCLLSGSLFLLIILGRYVQEG